MTEEFKKPERITIDAIPYLKQIMGKGLIKDLHDGEQICPECQGTGFTIYDAPYGLSDDPDRGRSGLFPYKHQSISFCQNCYNGVLQVCPHCREPLTKRKYRCECEGAKAERCCIKREKEAITLKKAIKLSADNEIAKSMGMLFSEEYGYNEGYFSDWESFFDYWDSHNSNEDKRPEYVWGTDKYLIRVDADDIVERATEDLWEDAADQISKSDIEELQTFLDKWCSNQLGTTTYTYTHEYAIKIPWEDC